MPDASLKKSMPRAKPAPRKTAPSKAIVKGVGCGCAWLAFGQRHRTSRTRPAFVDGFCAGLDGQRRTWRCRRDRLDTGRIGPSHQPQRHSLLQAVEGGKVGLPFEVILRLAAVLGRKDPIPVAMKLTCAYNPEVWKTLENMGMGRLAVRAGRQRELVNVYRSRDATRQRSDEEFAAVLGFVNLDFNTAMAFRTKRLVAFKCL